ncbi:hypothetical protein A0H81_05678 [Grifola frondosa]|uniref:Uncharacterized protein n=1 Tax=Grifola frondosa TaxID=5627 RepID=A0A1C7MDZ0_GRIFR|nr:hypothetical protein A0H81_05678 [Grifola frondosa]
MSVSSYQYFNRTSTSSSTGGEAGRSSFMPLLINVPNILLTGNAISSLTLFTCSCRAWWIQHTEILGMFDIWSGSVLCLL